MKNKKGFTLIELLAVIVILAAILAIAGTAVIKSINDSREKAKYIAAQDIVNIAEAYMVAEEGKNNADGTPKITKINETDCVNVEQMITDDYLEKDVTNPETGENRSSDGEMNNQSVCKIAGSEQDNYKLQNYDNSTYFYQFDGYRYKINK